MRGSCSPNALSVHDCSGCVVGLQEGRHLYSLDAGDVIHSLVFSPNRYWL
jgi:hypothetical protein